MTETKVIHLRSGKMMSILFMHSGFPWIISAFIGFLTLIIFGFIFNYRFFFLSLIWIFLFVPLVIAFLYFFHGLKPLTVFNSIPHIIIIDADKLSVKIIRENKESESEELTEKEYNINLKELTEIKKGTDYILLFFGDKGWLWLPMDAYGNLLDFKTSFEKLSSSMN